jgi:Mg/Co/Ni transporter MgtE
MRLQTTHLAERQLRELRRLLADHNGSAATAAASLTAHELADLLITLQPAELAQLEPLLGVERLADAVAELDPAEAARLIERFSRAHAADIL